MYKVFNQQRAIIFTENLTSYKFSDKDLVVELSRLEEMIPVYQEFISKRIYSSLIFLIRNELVLFVDKFLSEFTLIEAAGGLVKNSKGELLMIYRFGKWDLPKGKIEKDESIQMAAIRECMEETALENISIENELESTYHIYEINSKPMLKRTFWFAMRTESDKQLKPQFEEGIEQARWMCREDVAGAMKNTYESLKDVIDTNYLQQ